MCETALCDNINTENVLGEYYLYKSVATPWYQRLFKNVLLFYQIVQCYKRYHKNRWKQPMSNEKKMIWQTTNLTGLNKGGGNLATFDLKNLGTP